MGRFAGLAGVQVSQGGVNFIGHDGNYIVRLGKIEFKRTRHGDTFIVNTEVVQSDCPTRKPGSKPSYVITHNQEFPEYQLADMKAFAAGLLGIEDPNDYNEPVTAADMANTLPGQSPQDTANMRFWDDNLEAMVGPAQPMNGVLIRLNCTHIPPGPRSKPGSKGFTRHTWGPVVDESAVQEPAPF